MDAITSIRTNSDVTMEVHLAHNNQGITIDMPLLTLSTTGLDIAVDEPVTLPIAMDAAAGTSVNPDQDHTIQMTFWDYLPDGAM